MKVRALEVCDRLSNEEAGNFEKLKEDLLTERGFRKKFRYSKPGKSETCIQLCRRLTNYLEKWVNVAKVEKMYIADNMVRGQFLGSCYTELYVHLKPKVFGSVDEIAREADLFAEARGGVNLCVSRDQKDSNSNQGRHNVNTSQASLFSRKPDIK